MPRTKKAQTELQQVKNPGDINISDNKPTSMVQSGYISTPALITYDLIQRVANDYANGQFHNVGIMFDNLLRDSKLSLAVNKRIDSRLSCPVKIVSPTDDPQDIEFAQFIQDNYRYIIPESEERYLMKQWLLCDTFIGTLAWNEGIPTVYGLHPINLQLNTEDNSWQYQTRDEVATVILNYDTLEASSPDSTESFAGKNEKKYSWIFATQHHIGSKDAKVCNLGLLWWAKQIAYKQWTSACNYFSTPTDKIYVPAGAPPEKISEFVMRYLQSRDNKYVVLERGTAANATSVQSWDVDTINNSANIDTSMFADLITNVDREYLVTFLHGNLSTEVSDASGGTRATAETHFKGVQKLMQVDNNTWNSLIGQQVFAPFAEQWNPLSPPSIPTIVYDTSVDLDSLDKMNLISTFFDMLSKVPVGITLNETEKLASSFGISISVDKTKIPEVNGQSDETTK